jgi:PAS domain S-box-containing protein
MTDKKNIFSESGQRRIFDSSHDAFIISDINTKIVYANRSAHKIFGYETGTMIGMSILESMPDDKRGNYFKDMEQSLKGETVSNSDSGQELFAKKKNGEVFPIELTYIHYRQNEQDYFITQIKDISDTKRFEKEITYEDNASKGRVIDSLFRIEKQLGSGAQGMIYHVKTVASGFDLALKLINIPEETKARFNDIIESVKAEFSIIKSLHHRNIIGVYDFGYDKNLDKYYYTMDYLQGMDLRDYVTLNPRSSFFPNIVYQILDGLNYLHSNNIIHFDIKPENIFIINKENDPQVKILDFGLSEIKKHNNQNLSAKGTLSYIAPEFFLDPTKVSPKIDLYSLGITLIHVNKGMKGTGTESIGKGSILQALNAEYERNMELLDTFRDKKIKSFISQLTEKNPGTRISSAVEAIIWLNRIFGTNFKIPSVHHITSFLNNPKFVLRDEACNKLKEYRSGGSVLLTGLSGTGKSKLLNQLVFESSLDLQKVLKIYLDDNTSEDFFTGKILLKKIYNLYRSDINIEDEYAKITADLESIIEKEQDYSYIFDDIIALIFKCSSAASRLTLLFDNYERYDTESARFVNRLFNINKNTAQAFIVISVATDRMNETVSQSYKLMEFDPEVTKIDLPLLSYDETHEAIELFLGKIGSLPADFAKKIYDHSGGNFRRLMVYFDEFFQNGVLNYVSGLLLFRDQEKFNTILKSKNGKSLKSLTEGLDDDEMYVLKLLCVTINKLTIDEIKGFISLNEYDLKTTLNKLFASELISGYNDLYKAIRSEVKNFVFKRCTTEELIRIYTFIAELQHEDKFSQYAVLLIKAFISPAPLKNLSTIDRYIERLEKGDTNDNLFYLLLNSLKIATDKELRFRLEVNYARFLMKKDTVKAVKLIENLDVFYRKKDRDISNKISFIRLKLKVLDFEKYNYDAFSFVEKAMPVMEAGMKAEEIYILLTDFIKNLLDSGEYFSQGVKIITLLESKFARDVYVPFEYPNVLNTVKFVNGVVEWKEEYEKLVSGYIDAHIKAQLFNNSYFYLLKSIGLLVEKDLLKNDYSERLTYGLEMAYKLKDLENMFVMYTTLSTYHYYKGNYEKSLYWDEKKIHLKQKLKKELNTNDIGDIATTKANLYYPLGEVISLIQESRRQAKEKNELSDYILNITNEFILLHRKGDLKNAKSAIRKAYLYFKTIPDQEILRNYDRCAKYFPEVFSKKEAVEDTEKLMSDNTVSAEVCKKMKQLLDKYYEFNICYRWAPARMEEILSGNLEIETPMMLLHYLKQYRRLPVPEKVFGKIEPRYLNPECTGDHLVFLVTKFMMSKDFGLIDSIFEFSRKLHIAGYVMINIYTIIPFMEFALMVSISKDRLKKFIEFYEEISSYLYENMDEDQVGLFESTYFFRRGKKIIEYYNNL